MSALTARELLEMGRSTLGSAGIETPELDADVLLRDCLGWSVADRIVHESDPVPDEVTQRFRTLVERRARREPLAYVRGVREFHSLEFVVDSRVLVPRPETEDVVDVAARELAGLEGPVRVVDLGTGSGAILISLARIFDERGWTWVGVDRSRDALEVARGNAVRLAPEARLRWCVGDLLAGVAEAALDAVVTNPPYVAASWLERAQPELGFEPDLALRGGDPDGLGVLRRLLPEASRTLKCGGLLVSEIGSDQGAAVAALAREEGFDEVRVEADLAGLDRVLVARRSLRRTD